MPQCNGCNRVVKDVREIHYPDGFVVKRCDDCYRIVTKMLNTRTLKDPLAWGHVLEKEP